MAEVNKEKPKVIRYRRPKPAEGKYRFFCTGTEKLLFEGFDVDLDLSFNQCFPILQF